MAKELPYFRFYPSEWLEGDITLENEKTQGLFIKICAWYWKKDCKIDLDFINKRLINGKTMLKQCLKSLIESEIVKINDNQTISIHFLDEQLEILSEKRNKKVEAGRKGGIASVKQRLSYKDNNKYKNKDIINKQTFTAATEILLFLNKIDDNKINEMIEFTQFNGNIEELKQKFSIEFISRYGLNKTENEVLETFQSWMSRDKSFIKQKSKQEINPLKLAAQRTEKKLNETK